MYGNRENVTWSQETPSDGLLVESLSLKQWLPAGRLFPTAPKPASLPLCPASGPNSLPLDTMLSVFLVLPLILFFKG